MWEELTGGRLPLHQHQDAAEFWSLMMDAMQRDPILTRLADQCTMVEYSTKRCAVCDHESEGPGDRSQMCEIALPGVL